jgi:cobalt-zinc-cadmium efflux system outer membrane protein
MKTMKLSSVRSAATLALWGGILFSSTVFPAEAPALSDPDQAATSAGISLDALVREVLEQNPELEFYEAELAAARAGRKTASRWENPEVTASIGSKRVELLDGSLAGEGLAWSVSVAQTFEWPGRIALRKAVANRQIELASLGLERFRAGLAARARYLGRAVFVAQEKAAATREVAGRLGALLEVLVQRDPAGVAPLLDRRIIEAAAVTLNRQSGSAAQELDAALIELNQLRGAPPDARMRLAGESSIPTNAPPLQILLEAARTGNFDLRAREAELSMQGFRLQLSKNERYPSITLAPFYLEEEALDEERIVGVSLTLPLPLWQRNEGGVEGSQARLRQAEAAARVGWREIERRVTAHALALEARFAEIRRWRPDAREQFREAAELADRHYRMGAVPVTLYVEMQTRYVSALEALLATESEVLDHWQQLELLVGRPLDSLGQP